MTATDIAVRHRPTHRAPPSVQHCPSSQNTSEVIVRSSFHGSLSALVLCAGMAMVMGTRAAEAPAEPGVAQKVEATVVRGAKAAASGIERGARAAASGIERGVKATARAVDRGVSAAASGVARGARAAASGVERGAAATERAVSSVAQKAASGASDKP